MNMHSGAWLAGGTPGEVTHSLWTAVEINYNRATAQPDRLEGVITASAFALTARDARRTPRRDAGDSARAADPGSAARYLARPVRIRTRS